MLESMLAAENKLKVSEERFRGIFQNVSTVAVQGYTMEGTVSYWNHASETFYGYTAEEALGRNLLDLIIPPPMYGTMKSAIQRMVETGKTLPAEELVLMHKDGSPIAVYSSQVLVQIPGHTTEVFCIDVNLTERKRAEEKFRNIVNASPMGIHIYQLEDDGRLVFSGNNRAADRLLGADNSAFIGLTIEEAFPALRDTEVPERYRRAARDGENWRTEHIDYHDGMISGAFEVYAFQVSQGMTAVLFNEITKRKRTEEELKGREDRARRQRSAITTLVLDASIMTAELPAAMSQVAKIMALSVEVARAGIWMLSEDESELRCLSMYESGPDRCSQDMVLRASELPRYFQALLDESRISAHDAQNDPRTSEMTHGYLAPLGITSLLDAGIQSEGKLIGVLCLEHIGSPRLWKADEEAFASTMAAIVAQIMANDRRRKAEWAQVESEELQRSLLQTIPDLILRTDIEGKIIFINEVGFPGIDSIDRGSLCGKSIFSFVPEQDRPKVMENARKRLKEDIGPQEYTLQFEDGTQVDAEINGAVVRDRDGKAVGMVYVVRNISDRKVAEKDKADLQAQLVQAQKMEAVGRLAGGVAHDFNNMLGAILGYTELALNKAGLSNPLSKYLQQIHKAAERSADLTRQLLTFARKQTVTPKVLDLNETVEGMLTLLRRIIGENIDLVWLPGSDLWPVKIDHSQFDQILTNLCVNARDAITGVGRLTIETDGQTFDEAYCRDHAGVVPGDFVLLAVSDNGCGMDKKTMDNLFEPFFTTKEQGKGTGLGLASVYGAVKQNNGFINVYSEPGLGTTFNIYLPRHVDNLVQTTEERLLQSAERGSETVLLVEDEPMILELTTTMLEQLGYTVLAAPLPGEAIRLAGEHTGHIDLLMTDVIMPEMNGHDLAQNLLSIYPAMKRLFMSGYTADVIAHHGVLDKGVHFIQKPFTLNDLSARIREVLDFRNDK
jgi:PAS domain S-box-containing protein